MIETQLLAVSASVAATLFGLLCLLLGWIGNKLFNKMGSMEDLIHSSVGLIHEKINGLDRRVTIVETQCKSKHDHQRKGDGE